MEGCDELAADQAKRLEFCSEDPIGAKVTVKYIMFVFYVHQSACFVKKVQRGGLSPKLENVKGFQEGARSICDAFSKTC